MMLIGSHAIKYWFPDFKREPKDIDFCVRNEIDYKIKGVEFLYNPYLPVEEICSPNNLYTLKMSHIFRDVNWDKHVADIVFLKQKGCVLDYQLFLTLYNFWDEYFPKIKRSNLQMSAADFFNNNVKCEHNHDFLHTLINEYPTFNKVLIGEVEVSEEKFNLLTFEEKCNLVYEEVYVMAAERFQGEHYLLRYMLMLKQFIMKHAPLWEAVFIMENYHILHKPQYDYLSAINTKLKKLDLNPVV